MPHADDTSFGLTRRGFVRSAGLAGGALAAGMLSQVEAARAESSIEVASEPVVELGAEDVILFQGDSITDAGRNRGQGAPSDLGGLGYGYPMMASTSLLGKYAGLKLQCYNRGISGNKVPDLDGRWEPDGTALNPRVLSILIGINDLWHHLNDNHDEVVSRYEEQYTALIARTKEALPETVLVICEPYVLKCGHVNDSWFPGVDNLRAAAKRVSEAAGTVWVPFQTMFDEAITELTPAEYWAGDGVHPSTAGHALMARTWLEVTGLV